MKILFLDIDGVLNYAGCDAGYGSAYFVEEEKLRLLAELIDATDAQIVLTSTWRYGAKDFELGEASFEAGLYEAFLNALDEVGLALYDCTGEEDVCRGTEIKKWLAAAGEIESFAILDDMEESQLEPFGDFLIQTNMESGLERVNVEEAKKILNRNIDTTRILEGWE